MNAKLFFLAIAKFLCGVVVMGALLFIPAGSFKFFDAWLLLGILFIPMFVAGIIMMFKNPELLKKRLNAKEEQKEQKTVIALSGLMFLAAFIVAGLNYRFGWIVLPDVVSYVAAGVFLLPDSLTSTVSFNAGNSSLHTTPDRCTFSVPDEAS